MKNVAILKGGSTKKKEKKSSPFVIFKLMAVFQPRGSIVEDVIPYILIWMVILPCSG